MTENTEESTAAAKAEQAKLDKANKAAEKAAAKAEQTAKAPKTKKITAGVFDHYDCIEGGTVDLWGVTFTREGDAFVAELEESQADAMIEANRASAFEG